jgi:hypothetical protein
VGVVWGLSRAAHCMRAVLAGIPDHSLSWVGAPDLVAPMIADLDRALGISTSTDELAAGQKLGQGAERNTGKAAARDR